MSAVVETDINWLRKRAGRPGTLANAVPGSFEIYGVLDLSDDPDATEDALLETLAPDPASELIAGWIDRGPWAPPPGDEHTLYWGWPYRFRRTLPAALRGLPAEGAGSFPDLLFPPDHAWLVSLLWDDGWRSIGTSTAIAQHLNDRLPNFHRLSPTADLAATGRTPN